jgi:hypothetical protein
LSDVSAELIRDKLLALLGTQITDPDAGKLLLEVLNCGGGVTVEIDDLRLKLVRRDGRYSLKKDDPRRISSMPPRDRR